MFNGEEKIKFTKEDLALKTHELMGEIKSELDLLITRLLNSVVMDMGNYEVKHLVAEREDLYDPRNLQKRQKFIEDFPYWLRKNLMIINNHKVLYCTANEFKLDVDNQVQSCHQLINENVISKATDFCDRIDKGLKFKKIEQLV